MRANTCSCRFGLDPERDCEYYSFEAVDWSNKE